MFYDELIMFAFFQSGKKICFVLSYWKLRRSEVLPSKLNWNPDEKLNGACLLHIYTRYIITVCLFIFHGIVEWVAPKVVNASLLSLGVGLLDP